MNKSSSENISVIIPAKNEANSLDSLLPDIKKVMPQAEIIVVNDGSSDNTKYICDKHGVRSINNPYNKGNGAAIKSGARAATNGILAFMDADGQHKPEDIPRLVDKLLDGFDMVVGARDFKSQASFARGAANKIYNWMASWMVQHDIPDLTSGFRVVRAQKFRDFLSILPNGFSYPTTVTMAFFRSGLSVGYTPISTEKRIGKSHIKLAQDGFRFFLVIFKIGVLYSPFRIFLRISFFFFIIGIAYYLYTYLTSGRFTNMSALLFITCILVFLIGLISEQITMLLYQKNDRK